MPIPSGPREAPDLWPLWDALPDIPLAVVRGQLSNLLSEATVTEMTRRRPALLSVDLPDIGHAPTLEEPLAVALIERFLALI